MASSCFRLFYTIIWLWLFSSSQGVVCICHQAASSWLQVGPKLAQVGLKVVLNCWIFSSFNAISEPPKSWPVVPIEFLTLLLCIILLAPSWLQAGSCVAQVLPTDSISVGTSCLKLASSWLKWSKETSMEAIADASVISSSAPTWYELSTRDCDVLWMWQIWLWCLEAWSHKGPKAPPWHKKHRKLAKKTWGPHYYTKVKLSAWGIDPSGSQSATLAKKIQAIAKNFGGGPWGGVPRGSRGGLLHKRSSRPEDPSGSQSTTQAKNFFKNLQKKNPSCYGPNKNPHIYIYIYTLIYLFLYLLIIM